MKSDILVGQRFDRESARFDAIYSGAQGRLGRYWDQLTRRNVRWRFDFTLEAAEPIAGRRILDVGCGSGRYCVALAERGAAQVVGIDLAPAMLNLGRELASLAGVADRCQFLQVGVHEYNSNTPFDTTVAVGFFDYVRDDLKVMRHLQPLTRDKLLACFPASWALRVPARKIWRMHQRCHVRFYGRREIVQLCEDSGFSVQQLVRYGPIYMLVAKASEHS